MRSQPKFAGKFEIENPKFQIHDIKFGSSNFEIPSKFLELSHRPHWSQPYFFGPRIAATWLFEDGGNQQQNPTKQQEEGREYLQ
jgi:hypothetical protein